MGLRAEWRKLQARLLHRIVKDWRVGGRTESWNVPHLCGALVANLLASSPEPAGSVSQLESTAGDVRRNKITAFRK